MILAALLLAVHSVEPTSVVEAERAFAADAQALGQWTAFAKWAHEDAVLVGRSAVNAREFASAQDDPEQSIRWWPVVSYLNCTGDLAISIGGWEDPKSGQGGQFHTVWQKGEQGWRYLVDMGFAREVPVAAKKTVEVIQASCEAPVNFLMAEKDAAAHDIGVSSDRSLHWRWRIGNDGAGAFSFAYWDGTAFKAHTVRGPAQEPAE